MIVCERYIWAAKRSPISRMLKKGWGSLALLRARANARESRIDQATLESEIGDWEDARSWDHPSHPLLSDSSLRPCLWNGASLGKEAVSADSGREGEVVTGVGRVRTEAF